MELIYTNQRGKSITFGYSPPFILSSFEGLGGVEADVQRQKSPYQDGSTHADTLLDDRAIPLTFSILANSKSELNDYRRMLSAVCNPKLRGELQYRDGDIRRIIDVELETSPFFPSGDSRGSGFQDGTIDLIALYPYWRDPQEVSRALRAYTGKFHFPFSFPVSFGISGDATIITNDGDIEAPVTIDIQGPITNPRITNKTTGQFIKINRSLSSDEILHIDTSDNNKRVEIYRDGYPIQKAIGFLDSDSDFWKLDEGENEIEHVADSGTRNAIVSIAWHNYFVGI
ncbi:phage tail family protein [Paraliobacillus sediminis]|uniref:phage tail family protein n=1 Tax=Paraliobacillus sediminis TaxID=1885916 RepID=UPI000E3B8B6E|nr:phage tail family protein [Paraliobacillus sediminis]